MIISLSETIVLEDVLPGDYTSEVSIAGIHNEHVPAVIQSKRVEYLVELLVHGHLRWVLHHVGTQVNLLLVVSVNHIKNDRLNLLLSSFTRVDIGAEELPGEHVRGGREAMPLVVVECIKVGLAGGFSLEERLFASVVIE